MRITYNAPVSLSFALVCTIVLAIDQFTGAALTQSFFSIGGSMNAANPVDYLRLIAHVIGHANWTHLLSNFAFILLLGVLALPFLLQPHASGLLSGRPLLERRMPAVLETEHFRLHYAPGTQAEAHLERLAVEHEHAWRQTGRL